MIQTVLRRGSEVMRKPKLLHKILAPVMGEGVMLTEGAIWRDQRRDLAVAFIQRKLDSYVPLIEKTADSVCHEMAAVTGPEGMDILTGTASATFRVICDIFLGEGNTPEQHVVDDAFRRLISPGSLARRLLPFAQS